MDEGYNIKTLPEENLGEYDINVTLAFTSKTPDFESTVIPRRNDAMMDNVSEADAVPPPTVVPPDSKSLAPIPPHLIAESPSVSPHPRSRPASRDTSPYPRSRPSTPNRPSTPGSSGASSSARQLPLRRSARALAKGPDRPRGPPELEAALTIAIRNLESDIYEWWCANHKPGNPIPTTAYLKSRSPRIRRAAEAVDEADTLLKEAIYGKSKKAKPPTKKSQEKPKSQASTPPGELPEMAFGELELNPQGDPPHVPLKGAGGSPQSVGGREPRRSLRDKESSRNRR